MNEFLMNNINENSDSEFEMNSYLVGFNLNLWNFTLHDRVLQLVIMGKTEILDWIRSFQIQIPLACVDENIKQNFELKRRK